MIAPEGSSWLVGILALAALLPLVVIFPATLKMFWFGDDWGLLSDYVDLGLGRWLLQPFAENFAPLFKLTWIAAVTVGHGSYLAMILLLWVSHVANLILFGVLVRRSGIAPIATSAALLAFGLSWTNLESLAWSPQLSQLVSVSFFLLSWIVWTGIEKKAGSPLLDIAIISTCLLVSGLFFFRGAIGGIILALYGAGERLFDRRGPIRRDLIVAALTTVVVAFGATLHVSASETGRLAEIVPSAIPSMTIYAAGYLLLNPFLLLLRLPWQELEIATRTSIFASGVTGNLQVSALLLAVVASALAIAKIAIVAFAMSRSRGRTRLFILALLAFDVANAVLLGIGRYHLGLGTAVSSRYQYISWLGFAPCLGIAFQSALTALAPRGRGANGLSRLATVMALVLLAAVVAFPWLSQADTWAEWRGTAIQQELRDGPANAELSYTQITIGRARELAARFTLH